ncbi:M14 family metallopeptidase [Phenylobacterium deserti]|uniref:Carboxypeptidase n=1 Tax=Phenylobacterium deserti TaxID=1914756 RepID=A0A328AQ36_9CAUL|nr:M14 family metallopeptidase [Phenylobacterium deserti]RAK57142.1 carboxypeptidase [Phenylobacterium deserti]
MKTACSLLALALLAAAAPAQAQPAPWSDTLPPALPWRGKSEQLVAKASDPWITPSERAGFASTPSYADTVAYVERLAAASPLFRIERFGRTPEGRDLIAVVASKDPAGALDPAKPLVLIQAGIHSGEIDGKDAGLMLLRDMAFRGKAGLLDRANLVFVPIFNADGHENTSPFSRPNQRGPQSQGWRTTGQNINLNRDYAKADSPEMQAMLGLIGKYDPDLYLDVHVTDGVDYVHDITFSFPGWHGRYARSPQGGAWLDKVYRPQLEAALRAAGHFPAPYLDPVDPRAPEKGIAVGPDSPRFSTGYGDARRLPTVLIETHSLKPYRQRVLGTYVLLEQTLKTAAAAGAELKAAKAADRALRPEKVVLSYKPNETTPVDSFEFLPVQRETYRSAASGRDEVRWLGKPGKPVRVPVFGADPDIVVERPAAYWVSATKPEIIDRLRRHGVQFETLSEPRTVSVEVTRLSGAVQNPRADKEGRWPVKVEGYAPEMRQMTYPADSVRVATDQPLGELASLMLEARSPDGFLAWGFFPEILQRTEYMEGYIVAPLAERMLAADPTLKAEFEAKLAADPAFAADANARLAWFYQRTPFFDRRFEIYPVGRELAR